MISTIIPVYNRPALVKRAIESVLNQSYKCDEIIVVDDGSSDKTPEILKSFKDKIKIITQKNSGVSNARNSGIKVAKNRWIAFLDSDDIWCESKLQKQIEFHKSNKDILFSHTDEKWIRDGKTIKRKTKHKKPEGLCFEQNLNFCKIAPSTVMMDKSLFESVGYFDESLEVCEDYDLWLRVLKRYRVGLIKEELTCKFAGHSGQLSFKYHSMDIYRIKALLKHKNEPNVKEIIQKKLEILSKGAIKHKNDKIALFCKTTFQAL